MKLAFVDYENLMSLKDVALSPYELLIIFCGKTQHSLTFGEMPTGSGSRLQIIKVPDQGKNNLDFHIALELGRRHEIEDGAVEFHVLTNDTDLDKLLKHLRLLGRKCRRVRFQNQSGEPAPEPAKKAPAAKKTTAAAQHDPDLPRILSELSALPLEQRPKRKSNLLNWIGSRLGQAGTQEKILANLLESNEIQASGETITYRPAKKALPAESPPADPSTKAGPSPPPTLEAVEYEPDRPTDNENYTLFIDN